VGDRFYVYYTKSPGAAVGYATGDGDAKATPWDHADVWYATSEDGHTWTERGVAVERGSRGAFDDRSVFTPDVLAHGGRYFLVYQVVQRPYRRRSDESIAMAVADPPDGPWRKTSRPILEPTRDGEWLGQEDNRILVKKKGGFDSNRVHDPMLLFYRDEFWLYYKGVPFGMEVTSAGLETMWGVAIAKHPEGPYRRSPYNPATKSGHETLVWPHRGGIAALLTSDGPEKGTIQYAPDGINFEIMAYAGRAEALPHAAGPFRTDTPDPGPHEGIRWRLCHSAQGQRWSYIQRFEVNDRLKSAFLRRESIS
jgi:hypothetical protein